MLLKNIKKIFDCILTIIYVSLENLIKDKIINNYNSALHC